MDVAKERRECVWARVGRWWSAEVFGGWEASYCVTVVVHEEAAGGGGVVVVQAACLNRG